MATPRLLSGRYEIVRRLRVGRIVQVYEGIDKRNQRRVAIELLRDVLSNDRAITSRFMEAGKTTGGLVHPHIAKVYATAEDQGVGFLVSELVEGPCLRDLISGEGQVKPDRATTIAVEICEALEFAHERGVLHGCPTPSDVLLTEAGQVKLTGFGIPAAIGTADGYDVKYRAPEQASMAGDHRSDLYALGCSLYEMLLGRAPFHGDPQLADRLAARAPAELTAITTRLLSERPGDRYQSAAETRAKLTGYLGTPEAGKRAAAPRAAGHVRSRSASPAHGRTSPIRGSAALVSSCALLAIAAIAAATQVDIGGEQAVSGSGQSQESDETSTPTGADVIDDGTSGSSSSSPTTDPDEDSKDDESDEDEKTEEDGEDAEDEGEEDEEGSEDEEEDEGPSTTPPTTSGPSDPPPTSSPSTTEGQATVPGVVGMSESQARSTLASHSLSMSVRRVRVYDSNQDGQVISQSPGGGSSRPSSGTVSVEVGRWCLLIC